MRYQSLRGRIRVVSEARAASGADLWTQRTADGTTASAVTAGIARSHLEPVVALPSASEESECGQPSMDDCGPPEEDSQSMAGRPLAPAVAGDMMRQAGPTTAITSSSATKSLPMFLMSALNGIVLIPTDDPVRSSMRNTRATSGRCITLITTDGRWHVGISEPVRHAPSTDYSALNGCCYGVLDSSMLNPLGFMRIHSRSSVSASDDCRSALKERGYVHASLSIADTDHASIRRRDESRTCRDFAESGIQGSTRAAG